MAQEIETSPHRLHATFASLRNPNSRIYFVAQLLSDATGYRKLLTSTL